MTLQIRHPRRQDAPAAWRLVQASGVLDLNSLYAYVLLFEDFSATCAVAEEDGELIGFVTGYRPPRRPDVHFVWQVGVRPSSRGRGVASRLITWVLEEELPAKPLWLEATVTPSNRASQALFLGLARRCQTHCVVLPGFSRELLGEAHEPEDLYRIGPFDRSPP